MVLLMRSCEKQVECRIDVDMGRFPRERINKAFNNFTKKLKTCVSVDGGHIKHKFLKHYQVFFYKKYLKFDYITLL